MKLVDNWKKLWRSWSLRFAALGVAIPELLQLVADNTDAFGWLDGGYKSGIRLACLVLVILSRPIKQEALAVALDKRVDPS
jgi:hypothetical protein